MYSVTFAPLEVLISCFSFWSDSYNNKLISNFTRQFSFYWQKLKNCPKICLNLKMKHLGCTINVQEISSVCLGVSHLLLIHSFSSVVQELTCWSLSVSNIRLPRLTCRDKEDFKYTIHILQMLNCCPNPKTGA